MPSLNAATTLEQAQNFASNFAGASLVVLAGANVLATHPVTSFTASNNGNAGRAVAVFPAAGVVTITGVDTQTADAVELRSGSEVIDLVIGVDITLTTTTFVNGEDSTAANLTVNFPAS
jgi:hypothetical protein